MYATPTVRCIAVASAAQSPASLIRANVLSKNEKANDASEFQVAVDRTSEHAVRLLRTASKDG